MIRDIERKIDTATVTTAPRTMPERAEPLRTQHRKAKNRLYNLLYNLLAPEVERINIGKSRHPHDFGVKAGITAEGRLIVGARGVPHNSYGGNTLTNQVQQAEILGGEKPRTAIVDLGNLGRTLEGAEILRRSKSKRFTRSQWSRIKRRQVVEPVSGPLKDDCRLRRNRLKRGLGDALHVLGCAAGYNLHRLLRWTALFCATLLRLFMERLHLPSRKSRVQPA